MEITSLSNMELIEALKRIVRKEHEATLELIVYLIELDSRKLYLELGFGSLFAFLTKALKYSEPAANRRITVARCVRGFPEVLELLNNKELSLSGICLFARILTPENKGVIISQVKCKSHFEIERIVSGYKPCQQVKESIIPLTVAARSDLVRLKSPVGESNANLAGSKTLGNESNPVQEKLPSTSTVTSSACVLKESSGASRNQVELTQKFKLSFAVDTDCMSKLNRVKSMLSGKFPKGASLEEVFSELLGFYLKKQNCTRKQKQKQLEPGKRVYIAKSLRQKLRKEAGHCCSFEGPGGVKCASTHDLEIDHIQPLAKGGSNEPSNLRVLCARHNRLMAERHFGREFVNRKNIRGPDSQLRSHSPRLR